MTLKQIFIVNSNLGMRAGKVAVQVAHGETLYMKKVSTLNDITIKHPDFHMKGRFEEWTSDGLMKKVVLKATQDEMLILIGVMDLLDGTKHDIWFDIVYDRGLTQVPADSMTCIVIEPLDEEMADYYFGYLKLL